jgi:4-amino-4-deoxy-L-arabinose transferase-like glycosyltransferase
LASVDLIDGDTTSGTQAVHAARLATAVLGAGAVVLLGLVALEAFGEAVALVAMLIAAVYPPLIELSATPYSENLLIVLELAAVWAALRARRAQNPFPLLVTAGVFTGLATATHQNGLVILLPLIFAALGMGLRWSDHRAQNRESPQNPRSRWTRALAAPAVLIAATALTIAPWTIRNAIALHRFVLVSDEMGITLAGTYNPTSAAERQIPYKWIYFGYVPADAPIARATHTMTEPAVSSRLTSAALHYIGDHPLAPLQVAYHNLRRLLELEGSAAWHDSAASIGVAAGTARIGVFAFWLVALLAAAGLVTRKVRRAPEWLWAIPILLAWSVLLVNSETPRFRSPIDPYLILLAACALVAAAARVRPRLSRANTQAPSPA